MSDNPNSPKDQETNNTPGGEPETTPNGKTATRDNRGAGKEYAEISGEWRGEPKKPDVGMGPVIDPEAHVKPIEADQEERIEPRD